MKKEQQNKIADGLAGLLNPNPAAARANTPGESVGEPRERKVYKTVCYNLAPEIIEGVKEVAYWDRKRANAVVTEALERYIQEWRKNGKKE